MSRLSSSGMAEDLVHTVFTDRRMKSSDCSCFQGKAGASFLVKQELGVLSRTFRYYAHKTGPRTTTFSPVWLMREVATGGLVLLRIRIGFFSLSSHEKAAWSRKCGPDKTQAACLSQPKRASVHPAEQILGNLLSALAILSFSLTLRDLRLPY